MAFVKATREARKARIAIAGASGSGKTYQALELAQGLVDENNPGPGIGVLDTEKRSASLYAHRCDFLVENLVQPFTAEAYAKALTEAAAAGIQVLIIDSLSHVWMGEGGFLEQADKLRGSDRNGFAAWAKITPQLTRLINSILDYPGHIIVTLRAKSEYATERDDRGRNIVRKIGLQPHMRDGIEFEFDLTIDLDEDHTARSTKDRTGLIGPDFGQPLTPDVGRRLRDWFGDGRAMAEAIAEERRAHGVDILARLQKRLDDGNLSGRDIVTIRDYLASQAPRMLNEQYTEALERLGAVSAAPEQKPESGTQASPKRPTPKPVRNRKLGVMPGAEVPAS